ncbi:hypothetical protein [Streptomyces olivaceoviridis]|uniref:hypothetical protein n=1 Tax=Streptomyces olivaceoviridis TaxID=1921 RepID=UPI00331B9396
MATIDYDDRHEQISDAARERLRQRYARGRAYLDPVRVMLDVRAAAQQDGAHDTAEGGREIAQDILAALTLIRDARFDLDLLEYDLIRAARSHRTSWTKIADHLALKSRQSAETRSVRLEAAVRGRKDRDVDRQRAERARQRNADAWCGEHAQRIQAIAHRLADVAGSWPQMQADTARRLRELAETQDPIALVERLNEMRFTLAPYGLEPPAPVGSRATEAAEARDAALVLLDEHRAIRTGAPGIPAQPVSEPLTLAQK